MDFTTNLQCLSLGPTSSKSSFVYSSVSTVKSATSATDAYALLTDILHKRKVVICSTRRDFIRWCANSFTALTQGQLRGVGHCAIVVGERGTGKSFLFQKIASAIYYMASQICYELREIIQYVIFEVAGGVLFGIVTCFNGTFSRKSAKKLKF